MWYRIAADAVLLIHFAFIVFVVAGGLLVIRWRRVAFIHIPAAVWAALIELRGWICPLTPLEQGLREGAGGPTYSGGFIEQYLDPVIYPAGLTRGIQVALGVAVIAFNLLIYLLLITRAHRGRRLSSGFHKYGYKPIATTEAQGHRERFLSRQGGTKIFGPKKNPRKKCADLVIRHAEAVFGYRYLPIEEKKQFSVSFASPW